MGTTVMPGYGPSVMWGAVGLVPMTVITRAPNRPAFADIRLSLPRIPCTLTRHQQPRRRQRPTASVGGHQQRGRTLTGSACTAQSKQDGANMRSAFIPPRSPNSHILLSLWMLLGTSGRSSLDKCILVLTMGWMIEQPAKFVNGYIYEGGRLMRHFWSINASWPMLVGTGRFLTNITYP